MPDQNPARRARPADRKRQLVDRAVTLFADRGYPHVSVADVARAAGVTAPSVYRHFDDKQALLAAAVLSGVDDLEACTDRALRVSTNRSGGYGDLLDALCTMGVARPATTSLWRWNSTYLTPEQNHEVVVRTRATLSRWAQGIAAHRPDISDRNSVRLAWAALSVSGSMSVHHTRLSPAKARAELRAAMERLISLDPDDAPPLVAPPSMATSTQTRRDDILDAAGQLFARRGYADVGVDDIGAAVGITGPSVYKHFPSKLAILVGIGQRSAMRLEAGAMAAYSTTTDPAKLLSLLVDSYVLTITSSTDLSVAFNSSSVLAGQPAATELLDVQRRYVARWIDLLIAVHPDLSRAQAAIAVHASLSIVNDAVRMGRGAARPEFPAQMAFLMKGVLGV